MASVGQLTECSFGFQPRLLQLWWAEVSLCQARLALSVPGPWDLGSNWPCTCPSLPQASCVVGEEALE